MTGARGVWRSLVLAALGVLACTACGGPTEPVTSRLVPGRYVLTTLDGAPAPFITGRLEQGDTLTVFDQITYDTVVVINDSSARQHVRTANVSRLRNDASVETGSQEVNTTKTMIVRDDEMVLVATYAIPPVYLTPVGGDLIQRIQAKHLRCGAAGCQAVSNRIARARYVRQ